jgi:hypothetical protein
VCERDIPEIYVITFHWIFINPSINHYQIGNIMTFRVLKRNVILGILLFNAASEAAVRGEWNTEHETLLTTTHQQREGPSQSGDQRHLSFVLSEGNRQQEWTPLQSFPEVYHHHHHYQSSNQRKMKSDMPMFMMNTMSPTNRSPTRKPTSKVKIMHMGKKGMSNMEMGGMNMKTSTPITSAPITSQPVTNPPVSEAPITIPTFEEQRTGEQPYANVPIGDALSPIGDGPTADGSPVYGPVSIGSRTFQNRIVGGTPAGINEFKFFASLDVGCGGSLIAPGIVLTAAHCAGNIRTVRIGSSIANSGGVVKSVTASCMHPNYQSFTLANDYMLLKLDSPVDINQYPPIQLNNNSTIPQTNQILTVIGFGATSEGGYGSNNLLKVNVPANSHQQCSQQYGRMIVESVMFCAGEIWGGKDSCQGDSGGPIFEIRGGKAVQVGIVSFGIGCARPNKSGVYSRVSGAYDWIQTTMAKLNNGDTSGCRW